MAGRETVAGYAGREVRVFLNPAAMESSRQMPGKEEAESDDFYELTAEDYARLVKKKNEERFLKTKCLREAELAARRARITKATVRVLFPDNIILEADFKASDSIVEILELLKKVLLKPELPFCLFTTPPKKVIKNHGASMYDVGLVPGGLLHFVYENADFEGPYLREDVLALQHLPPQEAAPVRAEHVPPQSPPPTATTETTVPPVKQSRGKPKWLKLGK